MDAGEISGLSFTRTISMNFRKCTREPRELSGTWRLASVQEVHTNLEVIKDQRILDSWDIARLLDGWMSGPGYRYEIVNSYRPRVGHMLLVETQVSRSADDSFPRDLYSEIISSLQGIEAALLLSCDDKIAEVIYWVLQKINNQTELDSLTKKVEETFVDGRTILHYAADQPDSEGYALGVAKLLYSKFEFGKELVKLKDKYGRTALHFAALHGHLKLCDFLINTCNLKVDEEDQNEESMLHFAAKGDHIDVVEYLFDQRDVEKTIYSRDVKGKTALHKASQNGNTEMIDLLVYWAGVESRDRYIHEASRTDTLDEREMFKTAIIGKKRYIRQADLLGQTALHEAATRGHRRALDILLKLGSRPLQERTSDGKTALHYAVQFLDDKDVKYVAWSLLRKYRSNEEKSLLLWASATGLGTAEESAHSKNVKKILQGMREEFAKGSDNLLRSAVKLGLENMAWELINRGANVDQLTDSSWIETLNPDGKELVEKFKKYMDTMPERDRDQPTIDDKLGRSPFAEGLATIFLNPYVKSPVSVGIFGDWGMGKSSLMIQTESLLLEAAAQLAFPHLLDMEAFPGSKVYKLSKHGKRKYQEISKAVKKLVAPSGDEDPLVFFLGKYQREHHEVYRSLALMDRSEMIERTPVSNSERDTLGKFPSILTVRYNAWHYRNDMEAWAGLAVEITKVIEDTMTTAQTLRTCCRYAWKENKGRIWLELILPSLIASFLAVWVGLATWLLLSKSKHKDVADLKYGSIPVTLLVIVWTVVKLLLSAVKPISDEIMGYVHLPDHKGNLGYQQKVIDDINFLKEQMTIKPTLFWKFLAGTWCGNWFGLYPNMVKDTAVPKSPPASKNELRIIVFVDDLDRCNDAVILQVLSAVHLVLTACEINVILGMDKNMIARAIANTYQADGHVKISKRTDFAEKYISKIVQLPLALPDPSDAEIESFLHHQTSPAFQEIVEEEEEEESASYMNNQDEEEPDSNWDGAGTESVVDDAEYASETESLYFHGLDTGNLDEPDSPTQTAGQNIEIDRDDDLEDPALNTKTADDVALDVEQNGTERSLNYFSRFTRWINDHNILSARLCDTAPFIRWMSLHHDGMSSASETTEKGSKLQSKVLNSQMMMQNYSQGELEALSYLRAVATQAQRIPRKWKQLLKYHRLAWNVLFKIEELKTWPGWQLQLLAWTFCCWQWKHQLNSLIKNWRKLVLMKYEFMNEDGPSLRNITEHYIEKIFLPLHSGQLDRERIDKAFMNWNMLKETLTKYDVSMHCIKYFQKFRFHCRVGDLPWPLPEQRLSP